MKWNGKVIERIGDLVNAILAIDNEADAAAFFAAHVADIEKPNRDGTWESDGDAIEAARSNIGWCFGEGMNPERIQMWVRVTGASHPVFGDTVPTPEEAFRMGMARAVYD